MSQPEQNASQEPTPPRRRNTPRPVTTLTSYQPHAATAERPTRCSLKLRDQGVE
jgi:hypothetical protein